MSDFEPSYAAEDLAEPEYSYPVIVTIHSEHIVWLEAESLKDALDDLRNDGSWYEHLGSHNQTVAASWEEMRAPGGDYHDAGMDWDTVYRDGDGGYQGVHCDAHVESWRSVRWAEKRAEEQRTCKAAGHPEVRAFVDKPYCNTCGYLTIAEPDHRPAGGFRCSRREAAVSVERPRAFKTWEEALAEALVIARALPPEHSIQQIMFGEFAESIGGGHYVSIVVAYAIGNTKRVEPPPAPEVERKRTLQVIEAWKTEIERRAAEAQAGDE